MSSDLLDFDDYASLSDREMLKMSADQLEILRADPAITPEMIAELEAKLAGYKSSVEAAENAEREKRLAGERLKIAADDLLAHPDLTDAQPIPVSAPKKKGN